MPAKKDPSGAVDEYIAQFPAEVQQILNQIRAVIKEAAPDAVEKISYQMPGFYLNDSLVWFGAYARHIGFYPTPAGIAAFQEELAAYKSSKGAVQFPLNQPIPYDLIARITRFKAQENLKKSGSKP